MPYERSILESMPFFASHMVILLVAFVPTIALRLPALLKQSSKITMACCPEFG